MKWGKWMKMRFWTFNASNLGLLRFALKFGKISEFSTRQENAKRLNALDLRIAGLQGPENRVIHWQPPISMFSYTCNTWTWYDGMIMYDMFYVCLSYNSALLQPPFLPSSDFSFRRQRRIQARRWKAPWRGTTQDGHGLSWLRRSVYQ